MQQSLKEEKTISRDEKTKRDTEFNNHVEAAQSLLPAEMCLDDSFPIGSMVGLTRDEANSLLLSYHESQNEAKSAAYYKKWDVTVFIHDIFVILDKIQSERALLSPTPSGIDDADTASPMNKSLITQEEKALAVVTPTPPSPSKRRRTNSNDMHLNEDIEQESDANKIIEMLNLKWDEIQCMETIEIKKYVQAYAATKEFNTLDGFFDTHSIDEQCENLIEFTIELLAENHPSTIHAKTSDDFIDNLDQLTGYFEYYLAFVIDSDDKEVSA